MGETEEVSPTPEFRGKKAGADADFVYAAVFLLVVQFGALAPGLAIAGDSIGVRLHGLLCSGFLLLMLENAQVLCFRQKEVALASP